MTDIPEHLIEAVCDAEPNVQIEIAAVLAALRPEDAHRVPAWAGERDGFISANARLHAERDKARAEVERLKAGIETKDKITLDLRLQEIVALTAEIERLKAENAELRDDVMRGESASVRARMAQLESKNGSLRTENARLRKACRVEHAIVTIKQLPNLVQAQCACGTFLIAQEPAQLGEVLTVHARGDDDSTAAPPVLGRYVGGGEW